MFTNWTDVWNVVWSFFWIFAMIAYLFALFAVVADLFRDHTLSGAYKALWVVFLIFVPLLTVLVYLLARGTGMQERAQAQARAMTDETEDYIRRVAKAHSPAEEIATAKHLADDGVITPGEFETIKSHALSR